MAENNPNGTLNPTPDPATPDGQSEKIKIMGEEFEVDSRLASTLKELEKEVSRKLSDRSDELGKLRKEVEALKAPVSPQPPEDEELETLLFVDPKKAIAKIEDRIVSRVHKEYVAAKTAEKSSESFWKSFYSDNKDISEIPGSDLVVEAVLAKNWDELGALPPSQASKLLADKTREHFVKMGVGKRTESSNREGMYIEPPSAPVSRTSASVPSQPRTLTDTIRELRKAKHLT